MATILQIPHDLLIRVVTRLETLNAVFSFLQVCQHFHALSEQPSFWIDVFDSLRFTAPIPCPVFQDFWCLDLPALKDIGWKARKLEQKFTSSSSRELFSTATKTFQTPSALQLVTYIPGTPLMVFASYNKDGTRVQLHCCNIDLGKFIASLNPVSLPSGKEGKKGYIDPIQIILAAPILEHQGEAVIAVTLYRSKDKFKESSGILTARLTYEPDYTTAYLQTVFFTMESWAPLSVALADEMVVSVGLETDYESNRDTMFIVAWDLWSKQPVTIKTSVQEVRYSITRISCLFVGKDLLIMVEREVTAESAQSSCFYRVASSALSFDNLNEIGTHNCRQIGQPYPTPRMCLSGIFTGSFDSQKPDCFLISRWTFEEETVFELWEPPLDSDNPRPAKFFTSPGEFGSDFASHSCLSLLSWSRLGRPLVNLLNLLRYNYHNRSFIMKDLVLPDNMGRTKALPNLTFDDRRGVLVFPMFTGDDGDEHWAIVSYL